MLLAESRCDVSKAGVFVDRNMFAGLPVEEMEGQDVSRTHSSQ